MRSIRVHPALLAVVAVALFVAGMFVGTDWALDPSWYPTAPLAVRQPFSPRVGVHSIQTIETATPITQATQISVRYESAGFVINSGDFQVVRKPHPTNNRRVTLHLIPTAIHPNSNAYAPLAGGTGTLTIVTTAPPAPPVAITLPVDEDGDFNPCDGC